MGQTPIETSQKGTTMLLKESVFRAGAPAGLRTDRIEFSECAARVDPAPSDRLNADEEPESININRLHTSPAGPIWAHSAEHGSILGTTPE